MSASYEVLSSAKISKHRNAVISKCSKGGVTIAQQLEVEDKNDVSRVFLKGAFHIFSVDELVAFRDAIDEAVRKMSE